MDGGRDVIKSWKSLNQNSKVVGLKPKFSEYFLVLSRFLYVSCSSTRTRGEAARTFPISPQTVMSAMCQPSLEPAVPLASVAPATCPSNQRDPVDDSGSHTHPLISQTLHATVKGS